MIDQLRLLAAAASDILSRARYSVADGFAYDGARDMYTALGYPRVLTLTMYRARHQRGGIAGRIVDAKPDDTWAGGAVIVENDDPGVNTPFEDAVVALDQRVGLWDAMHRADKLAGLGRYAVLLIGAPGALDTPLERASEIAYIRPFAEEFAQVKSVETDTASPRFGLPTFYNLRITSPAGSSDMAGAQITKPVHYSRVIHIADNALEDTVYGTPRLERPWNLLMDLDKVTGGGAEAFWNRANQGMQFDLDPTLNVTEPEKQNLRDQIELYRHGLERTLTTRGLSVNSLGSDVANFKDPADAVIAQISATVEIPQRVLMGSEQAKLAAEQDSIKYYRMIERRRLNYAEPRVLRPLINRLIEISALPPAKAYTVAWSQVRTLDEAEKLELAKSAATVNSTQGETVITVSEIRDSLLGLDPLTDEEMAGARAAQKGGAVSWKNVHRAADRFRAKTAPRHPQGLSRRPREAARRDDRAGAA